MFLAACTDLEVVEQDSVLSPATGGGSSDPSALLSSAYEDLGTFTDQQNVYALYEHTTDELLPPTRGVDWGDNGVWRTLHAHTWDATHSMVLNTWNILHERAFKCTRILASNPSPEEAAEAKFLRAFYTFHAMDLYGQVPFKEATAEVGTIPSVLTRSQAYDFIENDLLEALPNLPVSGPDGTNGKASRAAANNLLARLTLNKAVYKADSPEGPYKFEAADMTKVVEYCDAVEADGYSLEDNYFDNFSPDGTSEIIWVSPSGSAQNRIFMTLHYDQNPSGWNGFTTLAEFYDKFDPADQRIGNYPTPDGTEFSGIGRGFLIGQQYKDDASPIIDSRSQKPLIFTTDVPLAGAATDKGIRVIKYHPGNQGNYVLMRFGETVVTKAEALLRGGNPGDALALVNELRAKRGAPALGSLDEAAMLDERGRELYWEGLRRLDQVRFGTFASTWSEKTVTDAFRVLFPIPQQALDSNPNLAQNAGY